MAVGDHVDVCTVVTKPYLAQARVLAKTLVASNSTARLWVLLADKLDGCFDPAHEPFKLITLDQLGYGELVDAMCFYYTPFELSCAVRGLLHEYLWNKTSAPSWVFLDSDIYVTGDLSEIFAELERASVLLSPHLSSPAGDEFIGGTELQGLQTGLYNGGFLGIRRCEAGGKFIEWFSTRLIRHCASDGEVGFVDQLWLNYVPIFFRDVKLCEHPGANLAHWNLYRRNMTRGDRGQWLADGRPVLFVHFSGWDIKNPKDVSKYSPAYRTIQGPQREFWAEVGEKYARLLLSNGHATTSGFPYAFEKFDDGRIITRQMRKQYYKDFWTPGGRKENPFARGDEFYAGA